MPTFSPPTSAVVPPVYAEGHRDRWFPVPRRGYLLMRHASNHYRGSSVLKISGVWQTIMHPTQTQIDSCDLITDTNGQIVRGYFQGGHVHPITAAVATELTNGGYGAYVV